ncbi:MAG TPA: 2-hydroxymuconate tautomerase [Ilumatobacteraceae bacterium]|nr:2-hydroxymuconate tautomerase [Ilumatobacteraceae bacterium]
MPLVNVNMASGRTDAQKKALLTAIHQAVMDTIGAPAESIRVWITEFEPTEFMAAGELLADRRARQQGG